MAALEVTELRPVIDATFAFPERRTHTFPGAAVNSWGKVVAKI